MSSTSARPQKPCVSPLLQWRSAGAVSPRGACCSPAPGQGDGGGTAALRSLGHPGAARGPALGGRQQLAFLSGSHRVIWGIHGRAANVSVSALKHKSAFPVLVLNSLRRSVTIAVVRCFQRNYKVISEAACGV